MSSKELEEIRRVFELVEAEANPERKYSLLVEALDLTDDYASEQPSDGRGLTLINNLRQSHLRRLIAQLTGMRTIDIGDWFNYIKLFLLRVEPDVKLALSTDPALKESYRKFMGLWSDDLLAAMEKYR